MTLALFEALPDKTLEPRATADLDDNAESLGALRRQVIEILASRIAVTTPTGAQMDADRRRAGELFGGWRARRFASGADGWEGYAQDPVTSSWYVIPMAEGEVRAGYIWDGQQFIAHAGPPDQTSCDAPTGPPGAARANPAADDTAPAAGPPADQPMTLAVMTDGAPWRILATSTDPAVIEEAAATEVASILMAEVLADDEPAPDVPPAGSSDVQEALALARELVGKLADDWTALAPPSGAVPGSRKLTRDVEDVSANLAVFVPAEGMVFAGCRWNTGDPYGWAPWVDWEKPAQPVAAAQPAAAPPAVREPAQGREMRWEGLTPDHVPTLDYATMSEIDLVKAVVGMNLPEFPGAIQVHRPGVGWVDAPEDTQWELRLINNALARIGGRMDRGTNFIALLNEALSIAGEVHDRACAKALLDVLTEWAEEHDGKTPAQDIRQALVLVRTTETREQLRRLTVIVRHAKDRYHNLSRQVELLRSMGSNVKAEMTTV